MLSRMLNYTEIILKYSDTRSAFLLACFATPILPLVAHAETKYIVDVLGIYSDHVAQKVADPKAMFVRNIEYANRALQNSKANYRYNLVQVEQQNWTYDDKIGSSQLESITLDTNIQRLRDEYGADLVAGVVPSSGSLCGIGYMPPANKTTQTFYNWAKKYGYSLSGHNCGGRTMSHEMGHNLGLGHSPAQSSMGTLADWGRGWGVNSSFVTIMAYNSAYDVYKSTGRLQIHSNPSLKICNGYACGRPKSEQDGADATQALNLASSQVSQWRESVITEPDNDPPIAVDDSTTTDAGKAVTINVLNNDSDPNGDAITISSVSAPENGKAITEAGEAQITYTPDFGFTGYDGFTYAIMDSHGATATASVSVQVKAKPDGDGSDSNLAINSGAEQGLDSWFGAWGAEIALSSDVHSGQNSIQAYGGRGVFSQLHTPVKGDSYFAVSGWVKATEENTFHVYLRLRQNGSWRYHYITTVSVSPTQWVNFSKIRFVDGPKIDGGYFLLYSSSGIRGKAFIDDISVETR